ncbi:hypothetical protein RQP46_010133 [Phenoliferia psychrophenolica]
MPSRQKSGALVIPRSFPQPPTMSSSTATITPSLITALTGRRGAYALILSTVIGTSVWHSFVGGPIQYKSLPRATFGHLQSRLFPTYFAIQGTGAAALLGLWTHAHRAVKGPTVGFSLNAWLLGGAIGGAIANLVAVGPWTTGIMNKRHRLERLEGTSYTDADASPALRKLSTQFGIAHSVSALLNLGVLLAAIAHSSWVAEFGSAL